MSHGAVVSVSFPFPRLYRPFLALGDLRGLERSFTPHSSGVASLSLFGLELSGNVQVRPTKNGAGHLRPTFWRRDLGVLFWTLVRIWVYVSHPLFRISRTRPLNRGQEWPLIHQNKWVCDDPLVKVGIGPT